MDAVSVGASIVGREESLIYEHTGIGGGIILQRNTQGERMRLISDTSIGSGESTHLIVSKGTIISTFAASVEFMLVSASPI